jgi:hypothetical protein
MSVGIWARKTMALALAVTLAGPSVSLLAAQEQGESQEDKKARRQQQAEKQQQKQQQREQEQAQRRAQREEQAARQQERARQEQQQRQREREQRSQQQQERQADQQRARQEQREAQARRREQAEEARRQQQAERERTDQAQRDVERRQRRAEQARIDAEARAAEQARIAEQARAAELSRANERAQQAQREAIERSRGTDARSRQPIPGRTGAVRRGDWITEQQRSDVIRENQARSERFAREWGDRERLARERAQQIQRQRRHSYYRYQQGYVNRMNSYWRRNDWRRYDYWNDPYFWSPPAYRYRYAGQYYQINDYGADLLRDAVNRGYHEGFLAGQADREDRWRGDYRDSYVYEDATYGYRGLYVDQRQYAYYFRQGFDRGYADGYHSRYQYGYRDEGDNTLKILAGVLAGILILEAIH